MKRKKDKKDDKAEREEKKKKLKESVINVVGKGTRPVGNTSQVISYEESLVLNLKKCPKV